DLAADDAEVHHTCESRRRIEHFAACNHQIELHCLSLLRGSLLTPVMGHASWVMRPDTPSCDSMSALGQWHKQRANPDFTIVPGLTCSAPAARRLCEDMRMTPTKPKQRLGFFTRVLDAVPPAERYRLATEQVVHAERLGFDAAWVAQHHFHELEGGLPSPLIFLTYAAARTSRIRLGTAIITLPLELPIRVA